jgi:5S rRNA maturation endonuclease (ribonuclease M5)
MSRRANFNDIISVEGKFELDSEDKKSLKEHLEKNGVTVTQIIDRFSITESYQFKNSSLQKPNNFWSIDVRVKNKNAAGRGVEISPSGEFKRLWNPLWQFTKLLIPPIIYFPDFLVKLPDRISLEKTENEGKEQLFYRRLLKDILDSMRLGLDVETHLTARARSKEPQDKNALESVIGKMGTQITRTVFDKSISVFKSDTSMKSIVVSLPKMDTTSGKYYIELKMKDSDDIYYIRERSLGFRWFFTFLLFTQFRVQRALAKKNQIFLFDEPASNLHQSAQERLIPAFEALASHSANVIFATHSHHLISPKWLESTFVVRNKTLNIENDEEFTAEMTEVTCERYRKFVGSNPDQTTYFQPILDVLEYKPGNLENIPDVVMVEGKNDFYTLKYFGDVVFDNGSLALMPGNGAGSLDSLIRLYYAWGRQFIVLLDSDKEGEKQKERYEKLFGNLVKGRIFSLGSLDSNCNGKELEDIIDVDDRIAIQQSVFPDLTIFRKKQFNIALQECLALRKKLKLKDATLKRFESLIQTLQTRLKDFNRERF